MKCVVTIVCALAMSAYAGGQEQEGDDRFAALHAAVGSFVDDRRVPGLAVGIVEQGEVVFLRGYGEVERGGGVPVTPDSVFHTASLSKPVSATVIMQLVERGALSLDDTIVEHIPWFTLADEASRAITLRQVLTHTSGFPDVLGYGWENPEHDDGAAERFVRGLSAERLLYEPGTDSRYSNMAFDVLAVVVSSVTGQSFESYAKENVLEPLGMDASTFVYSEVPASSRTVGHSASFSDRVSPGVCAVYPWNRRHAPSSTLNSNARDMCRWMLANLGLGELAGARILDEASYAEMWSRDDETPDVGLSWWLEEFFGEPCVVHTGLDDGFRSHLVLLPERQVGVVVLCNSDEASVSAVVTACLHATLGEAFELPGPRVRDEVAFALDENGLGAAVARLTAVRTTPERFRDSGVGELDQLVRRLVAKNRLDEAAVFAALNAAMYPESEEAAARRTEVHKALPQ